MIDGPTPRWSGAKVWLIADEVSVDTGAVNALVVGFGYVLLGHRIDILIHLRECH